MIGALTPYNMRRNYNGKYNQLTPEIIAQIQAVSEHVLVGDDINGISQDEMPIYGTHMPDLVVAADFHRGSRRSHEDLL